MFFQHFLRIYPKFFPHSIYILFVKPYSFYFFSSDFFIIFTAFSISLLSIEFTALLLVYIILFACSNFTFSNKFLTYLPFPKFSSFLALLKFSIKISLQLFDTLYFSFLYNPLNISNNSSSL